MYKLSLILIAITNSMLLFGQSNSSPCVEKGIEDWKIYFHDRINNLDPIEGVWNCKVHAVQHFDDGSPTQIKDFQKNCIIVKAEDYFYECDVNDKTDATISNITYGDDGGRCISKITYQKTAIKGVYLYNSYLKMSGVNYDMDPIEDNSNAILTDGIIRFSINQPGSVALNESYTLLKLFPQNEDIETPRTSSGTGFALLPNGYIVTNFHVIDGAKSITVKGINGNFQMQYKAKVIKTDKNNDLAIIKIDDNSFTNLGKIPYTITSKISDVGSSVYAVGYPLRASMGDEIKLTNGIISSKSGFQGDITAYQISVPLQPGNSGGPLFDSKGNLIGIVNSKLIGAENASYAIKATYLLNLIESLETVPKLQTVNNLAGKSFTEQVKTVKNFTYIIEVK